ncbi:hypothetical protein [Bradyrhizobium sp. 62]|uniref:hypothetical protein n=1 Tax=Bradyrhizobium sp. 62 TaxID=1043588 RepID=UPI001FF8CE43|nr:hypothetical protein [Bradyrhizobium sp. 62]MCK1367602.1 hypothetical protein [Bradyrhizobium sp. 62]
MSFGKLGAMGRGFGHLGALGTAGYSPVAALGADLIAYWDVNRPDLITGLNVSSWRDIVAGYPAVQATGSAQPVYSISSFNGAPGIAFDGASQQLTCTDAAFLAALPSGAGPYEIWALIQQDALPADTTERIAVAVGGASLVTGRALSRIVTSATNRARSRTGNGAASTNIDDTAVDLSTRHVLRLAVGATSSALTVDGGTPSTASVVPSTTNTRLRLGASNATAAVNFWQGQIAAILITQPLSAAKAAALQSYLTRRKAGGSYSFPGVIPALGSNAIAYWDAARGDTLTVLLGAVASWNDVVAGYPAIQGTPTLKPIYGANSFNSSPGITFDGVDDFLMCTDAAFLAALPSGASPYEIWALVSQDALPADTTERFVVAVGDSSLITGRAISRIVTTGTNRARGRTGTGAAATNADDTATDLSGSHVIRYTIGATASALTVDAGVPTASSVVPATTNTRLRFGASNASAAVSFWQGQIVAVVVTLPLPVDQASALQNYLGSR